jgi:hypothetical protein
VHACDFTVKFQNVHVKGVFASRAHSRRLETGYFRQLRGQIGHVFLPLLYEGRQFFKLLPDNGCFNLVHPEVKAHHVHKVSNTLVFNHSLGMITYQSHLLRHFIVVCNNDAALPGMDMFVVI